MAQESATPDLVELTRTFFEAMDRDWDFDSLAGFFAPDAVFDLSPLGLGAHEGVAAIGEFLVGYWATWDDHHHKIEEILDLGHGVLFVALWEDGRPRGSNARVQARQLTVWEWVHGKVQRITSYYNFDEASAAAARLAESRG
jgi:ketosteroid isomerase-like protein